MSAMRWIMRTALVAAGVAACGGDSTSAPGPATAVTLNAGNAQIAVAGSAVATPPSVRVIDAQGNGVNGQTVNFAVASGGGAITGATQLTSGDGVAAVGSWTLGASPGANTLTATAPGLIGSPLTLTATAAGVAFQAAHGVANGTGTSVNLPSVAIVGANRLLLCVIGVEPYNSAVVTTSISLDDGAGGTAQVLSPLGTAYNAPSDGAKWTTHYVVAPTVGTRRLVATLSGSSTWTVACVSYVGADQASPFGIAANASNSIGAAALTVSSNAAGSLPWAHIFSSNTGFAAGGGVTTRQATGIDLSAMVDGAVRVPFAVPHTFNWNYSGQFGGQAVMLRPAALP